jgi:hypothetical protein
VRKDRIYPRWLLSLLGLVALVFTVACSGAAQQTMDSAVEAPFEEEMAGEMAPAEPAPGAAPEPAMDRGFTASTADVAEQQGILDARKVSRNADLSLIVEDTQTAVSQLRSTALALGGYVADASLWQVKDDLMRGSITLRIDSRNFDDALERIRQIALEVERENIGSQDVTAEYTDLDSRVRNLEATEQELLALLSEIRQQTNSADEVLQVYRELTRIREEIEQIRGRMQYLDNQISLATITVQLIPKEEKPIVQSGWGAGETFRNALSALVSAGQMLASAAIWLVVFVLPVVLVAAIPLALAVVGVRRWRGRPVRGGREQVVAEG